MNLYWKQDFMNDNNVCNELIEWIKEIREHSSDGTWIGRLGDALTKELEIYKLYGNNKEKLLPLPTFDNIQIPKKQTISNVTAKDLAEQITLMDYTIFSRIQARECLGKSWKKKNKDILAPNISASIKQFSNEYGIKK